MPATAEKTYRSTMFWMSGIAVLLLLLFVGMASYELRRKSNLPATHEAVVAKVSAVGTACSVEKKVNKSWKTQSIVSCEEAEKIVAENNGVLQPWRSVEGTYAVMSYTAQGAARETLMAVGLLSDEPVMVGREFSMYADKENPLRIEFPLRPSDMSTFWTMTLVGVIVALGTLALAWFIAGANQKRQLKALALADEQAAMEGSQGAASAPAPAVELTAPLWSKVVRYVGVGVAVLGLLMAAIAGLGNSDGSPDTLRGALIIAFISIGIWRLCAYIASLGLDPVRR